MTFKRSANFSWMEGVLINGNEFLYLEVAFGSIDIGPSCHVTSEHWVVHLIIVKVLGTQNAKDQRAHKGSIKRNTGDNI